MKIPKLIVLIILLITFLSILACSFGQTDADNWDEEEVCEEYCDEYYDEHCAPEIVVEYVTEIVEIEKIVTVEIEVIVTELVEITPIPSEEPVVIETEAPEADSFYPYWEQFQDIAGFSFTTPFFSYEDDGLHWTIDRSGGSQFLYKEIPEIEGDFYLSSYGYFEEWDNNCQIQIGVGDNVGEGVYVSFGYLGGGCSENGVIANVGGVEMPYYEEDCNFIGDWLWIEDNTEEIIDLWIEDGTATFGTNYDTVYGEQTYFGPFDTLWIGYEGDGDWPTCSGKLVDVYLETLE